MPSTEPAKRRLLGKGITEFDGSKDAVGFTAPLEAGVVSTIESCKCSVGPGSQAETRATAASVTNIFVIFIILFSILILPVQLNTEYVNRSFVFTR